MNVYGDIYPHREDPHLHITIYLNALRENLNVNYGLDGEGSPGAFYLKESCCPSGEVEDRNLDRWFYLTESDRTRRSLLRNGYIWGRVQRNFPVGNLLYRTAFFHSFLRAGYQHDNIRQAVYLTAGYDPFMEYLRQAHWPLPELTFFEVMHWETASKRAACKARNEHLGQEKTFAFAPGLENLKTWLAADKKQ